MENKYFYAIVISTIAVLVGLAFWSTLGNNIGTLTQIQNSSNASYTLVANGTTSDLAQCGQRNTTAVVIYNYTNASGDVSDEGGRSIAAGNYTITQAAGSDGYLSTRIRWDSLAGTYIQAGYKANVTCQYQPKGYITDGAGRSVANLIPILAALLIAIAALPDVREFVKDKVFG